MLVGIFACAFIFSITLVAQNHGALSQLLANSIGINCTAAGGSVVGGYCWLLGGDGESCDTVCSNVSASYDLATLNYAGSAGSTANCAAVMTAVTGTAVAAGDITIDTSNYGCNEDSKKSNFWGSTATSSSSSESGVFRFCACK